MVESTIHASAVLLGTHAVLIRGPSGSGKSQLALSLLQAGTNGCVRFARLIADDRARLEACDGRLLVRPAQALAGLIEVRGLGIRRLPYEQVAIVGSVVDLAATDAERLPAINQLTVVICGVQLPRLAVAPGDSALGIILASCTTTPA